MNLLHWDPTLTIKCRSTKVLQQQSVAMFTNGPVSNEDCSRQHRSL